jgi:cellulose synthase/poly-beta-1,6-N-acetylglucosamine synthase-like glycosyltransferase
MPHAEDLLYALLWLCQAATLLYVGYRFGLGLLSLRRRRPAPKGTGKTSFLILLPAHNEANVIRSTVTRLLRLGYPQERLLVVVVADDCRDATAAEARAAGARVLIKPGPADGKGSTIRWALSQPEITMLDWDALVLLDADSRPAADALLYMDAAVQGGAKALQARSESTMQSGWVARGYAFNHSQRNRIWHQAREMAGLSATLTGTGICLARDLIDEIPPETRTLTEDLEYSALLIRKGVRIHFLYDALIRIEQPHSLRSSVNQRVRWARGQIRTTLAYAPALLWHALRKRDVSAFDTALYLALPSLVPFQALLLVWGAGQLLLPDVWPQSRFAGLPGAPPALLFSSLGLSILLAYAGVASERRKPKWRDWASFTLLMASWLPIAVYAALTSWVRQWNRTPHGVGRPLPALVEAIDDEELQTSAAARS